ITPQVCYAARLRAGGQTRKMIEKTVLVGLIPDAVVVGPADQVCWVAGEGRLKIEFDPNRCPFSSNVFQAPAGMRLLSGTPRPATKPGLFKTRAWLNDQMIGPGEILVRETNSRAPRAPWLLGVE